MTYYVFSSYPKNKPTVLGYTGSKSKIREVCEKLHPNKVYVSLHPTKRDSINFVKKLRGKS